MLPVQRHAIVPTPKATAEDRELASESRALVAGFLIPLAIVLRLLVWSVLL